MKKMVGKVLDYINIFIAKKDWRYVACATAVGVLLMSFVSYKFCSDNLDLHTKVYAASKESKNSTKKDETIKEENIQRVHATYNFDVNKVENVVSDADYTFVAKVDKVLGTVYKFPVKLDKKWISMPYTKYRLKVLKAIKGTLKEGNYIEFLKAGGKQKNSSKYIVYERDNYPIKGGMYIFSTYVQKDGSFLVTGANSSIKTSKSYMKNSVYNKVNKASKRSITKKRIRYRLNKRKVYVQ